MSPWRKTLLAAVAMNALAALAAHAEPRALVLDPTASRVSFTLSATGHDVEGILAVKAGRLVFDPATGAASGEIAVDLKSAATGNNSRDKTMHDAVLESDAFPLALFRARRIEGEVPVAGAADVTLQGTLALHGVEHEVALPARVEVHGGHLKATTRFPVPFVEWGLHDPSILMLRVAKVVAVDVVAEGTLEAAASAPAGGKS